MLKAVHGKDVHMLSGLFQKRMKLNEEYLMELEENDITMYNFSEYADEMLILQGTKDEVVPPEMVSGFADRNGLLCLMIEGADHRFMDPLKMDEAIKEIMEFFELS